jgi:hypothetical protein
MLEIPARGNAQKAVPSGMAFPAIKQGRCSMSNPSDFTVEVFNERDIVISKPESKFEVTYRREPHYPMLIASEVLQNDFDESKVTLLAQAWKLALDKAKSLGWFDGPKRRKRRRVT